MRNIYLACLVFLTTSCLTAQTLMSGTALCAPLNPSYQLDAGDYPGHVFGLAQGKCTWTKPWEVAGMKNTVGTGIQQQEITGDTTKIHGTFVDNMENGDKAYYNFQSTLVNEKNGPNVVDYKWQLLDGTGKLKGVKGQGTCDATPSGPGGDFSYECTGEYTLPKS